MKKLSNQFPQNEFILLFSHCWYLYKSLMIPDLCRFNRLFRYLSCRPYKHIKLLAGNSYKKLRELRQGQTPLLNFWNQIPNLPLKYFLLRPKYEIYILIGRLSNLCIRPFCSHGRGAWLERHQGIVALPPPLLWE